MSNYLLIKKLDKEENITLVWILILIFNMFKHVHYYKAGDQIYIQCNEDKTNYIGF